MLGLKLNHVSKSGYRYNGHCWWSLLCAIRSVPTCKLIHFNFTKSENSPITRKININIARMCRATHVTHDFYSLSRTRAPLMYMTDLPIRKIIWLYFFRLSESQYKTIQSFVYTYKTRRNTNNMGHRAYHCLFSCIPLFTSRKRPCCFCECILGQAVRILTDDINYWSDVWISMRMQLLWVAKHIMTNAYYQPINLRLINHGFRVVHELVCRFPDSA